MAKQNNNFALLRHENKVIFGYFLWIGWLDGKPLIIIGSILQQNIFIRKLFAEELFYRHENVQQTQHQAPMIQNNFRKFQRDV